MVRDPDLRTACETYTDFVHQHLDLMKVEVAGMLVESVGEDDFKDVDSDVRERLMGMVELWKRCENEGVRRKAWEIEEKYLGKVRDKWGF
jgi:hypothetical protein